MNQNASLKRTTAYSNSNHDHLSLVEGYQKDEKLTRDLYEYSPYPDLGDDLKNQDKYLDHLPEDFKKKRNVYFDAGCGTGHYIVGIAKQYPHWRCIGVDLSQAALQIAQQLANKHGVKNVEFIHSSYLDPLSVDEKFDIISAMGTIHHCADPDKAMKIMYGLLKDDGYMLLHMYGWRADREKFDIKDMLNILEPSLTNYNSRFEFYRALIKHKKGRLLKRIVNTSLYDLYSALKIKLIYQKRKMRKISWSPPWHYDYQELSSPWIDHFCHPCERAYEVPGIQSLITDSGFKVKHMLSQGKEFPQLIPHAWKYRYSQLGPWEKYRLSELLATGGGSFAMILEKAER